MNESRWQLPEHPLRASAVTAHAAGVVFVGGAAWALRAGLHLTPGYPFAAAAVFFVLMGIALGFLNDSHPHTRFGSANLITMLRLALVALVASLLVEQQSATVAFAVVAAASAATALDGVDGWLARRRNMASAFGARFDMEIDALLILALSAFAYHAGKAGAWVLLSGLMRYAFVAAGSIVSWMNAPLPVSIRRKTVCVAQVAALVAVAAPFVQPPISTIVAGGALAVLSYSFLVDTLWLRRQAR
jgi:phosphatidylglycerophosphate synthase